MDATKAGCSQEESVEVGSHKTMEDTTLEPPPSVEPPSEMQQDAKSSRTVVKNYYKYCTFYNGEEYQQKHGQRLAAREGFGKFCLAVEGFLTRSQAVTLATWLDYQPAKVDLIQNSECDPPSRCFVQSMVERGEISPSDISTLIGALESDTVQLKGVATKVKEAFHNYVGQAQLPATDEEVTYARGKLRRPPEVEKENKRPTDEKPFVLQEIKGNIKKCTGCRKPLYRRGSLPKIPKNMTIGHFEQRKFFNKALGKEVERPGNVYYHVNLSCIRQRNPDFSPYKIVIPPGVTLTEKH